MAPSERYYEHSPRGHKNLITWARQMGLQLRCWLPERQLIVVADSSYAALDLLASLLQLSRPVYVITRLRLDAALYDPAPLRQPGQVGRPRLKGKRRPTLAQVLADEQTAWQTVRVANWYGQGARWVEIATDTAVWYHSGKPPVPIRWILIRDPQGQFKTQALLSTDQTAAASQILQWFVRRWQVEVTFQEVRAHLGVETQRQWSDQAIARTTPVLFGLFSAVTWLAHCSQINGTLPIRQAAWYTKQVPTFTDALAVVRSRIWQQWGFCLSPPNSDGQKTSADLFNRLFEAVCYAT